MSVKVTAKILFHRQHEKRVKQTSAVLVLQRNGRALQRLRNWPWWRLFSNVRL